MVSWRLTLNVLLSFAQFEREVTGERIRDKIAASKKKGLWMGGQPALGYDVKDRKLVVNEVEAATVRRIFLRYLALGSVRELKVWLDAEGIVSKRRTAADGSPYGSNSFSRGALYQMLQNRVYRGEIVHKGAAYPGWHPPIVDEDLWASVQRKLEANDVERSTRREASQRQLLAGVLFDADGEPMTPTHAVKKGVRYRYYVSRRLITGKRGDGEIGRDSGQRLPAVDLERLVVQRLRTFFADPDAVFEALPRDRRDTPSRKRALCAAQEIIRAIDAGMEGNSLDFLRPIIARAQVHADRIEVGLHAGQLVTALLPGDVRIPDASAGASPEASPEPDADGAVCRLRLTVPAALKRTGKEMKFVIEGADENGTPDPSLIRLLVRAHALSRRLAATPGSTLADVAAQEGMGAPYAARLMRLNYLAPDIVVTIPNGRQPVGLTASQLISDTRLPLEWSAQRAALGFG